MARVISIADVRRAAEDCGWKLTFGKQRNDKSGLWEEYIEFSQYSPAGEDFSFEVQYDSVADVKERVWEYASDFDVDEHVEMWIDARRNGMSGVPSIRELLEDAEAISGMLERLAAEITRCVECRVNARA